MKVCIFASVTLLISHCLGFAQSTFRAIDVIVDSGNQPLAAYQVTFAGTNGLKIVGIEGGEHPAFAEPPHYDPQAMQKEKVIIAAFNTASDLPSGKTRVATIHIQTGIRSPTAYDIQVNAAASSDGKRIQIKAELHERKGQ